MTCLMSLFGSMFIFSSSTVFSAGMLVFFSISLLSIMYWNMMSIIPLYIFSMCIIGGLYVLVGFVLMSDSNDLDSILIGNNLKECLWGFLLIMIGTNMSNFSSFFNLDSNNFNYLNQEDWTNWGMMSSTYIFLILFLLIFLFIIHSMMKGSLGGGGFISSY